LPHSAAQESPGPRRAGAELLPRDFFDRPAVAVAPDLLGCLISHQTAEGLVTVRLTEVEAYAGEADPASHAFRGRTARVEVMYGPPGHAYVYFTYGMHFCVNLVCQPAGQASAVLLRAGQVIEGVPLAAARRFGAAGLDGRTGPAGTPSPDGVASPGGAAGPDGAGRRPSQRRPPRAAALDLARGPARLCEALAIDRAQNGADAVSPASPLRVSAPLTPVPAADISHGPRVGVSRAADVPWRFWITGDPAVSPYRAHVPRRTQPKPVTGLGRQDGIMPQ
jgi:DNA-3-methyladenine glycosylase